MVKNIPPAITKIKGIIKTVFPIKKKSPLIRAFPAIPAKSKKENVKIIAINKSKIPQINLLVSPDKEKRPGFLVFLKVFLFFF